jgi:hypothetical protein
VLGDFHPETLKVQNDLIRVRELKSNWVDTRLPYILTLILIHILLLITSVRLLPSNISANGLVCIWTCYLYTSYFKTWHLQSLTTLARLTAHEVHMEAMDQHVGTVGQAVQAVDTQMLSVHRTTEMLSVHHLRWSILLQFC